MGQPIFEENGQDDFRGIDIMRAVRSFDPCLPCGVHMYLGKGKTLKQVHSPMFGAARLGERRWTTSRHASGSRGSRRCSSEVEALADPARARDARRSWCRRCSTSTARGSRRIVDARRRDALPRRSPTTSWSRTCCCCTGCTRCRVEARVRAALEEVRPYLDSHGGDVELVASRTASCGCGWRAAAAAARRRR